MRILVLLILLFSPCMVGPVTGQPLTETERAIAAYIEAHAEEQIALLERVVTVNSGTFNAAGVREVGRIFAAEFEAIGMETQWEELPDSLGRSGHLFAWHQGTRDGRRVLLIGHLDTVFEPDDPFKGFVRQDSVAVGPGVNDMKGGDVIILYALKALRAVGALDDLTVTVAFLGDEENPGYPPVSRASLREAAAESDVALGFETAVGLDWATVARRGSSTWRLDVTAPQSHSSGMFQEDVGAGAVFETARILDAFYSYLRGEPYLTFNPAVVLGGTEVAYDPVSSRGTAFGKTNVVASSVTVKGDLRFISAAQLDSARARMQAIVETGNLPLTAAHITFEDSYPAMPPTEGNYKVLRVLDGVSRALGQGPVAAWDPGKRGAADVSFVAHLVDALDGLGAIGDNAHAPGESIDLTTLPALTARAAILVMRLAGQGAVGGRR